MINDSGVFYTYKKNLTPLLVATLFGLSTRNTYCWIITVKYKVMKSFICRGCSNSVISTGHTSVDIGASANLEVVDKFCYLGDMLSVDGDADAAVETRIQTGWNKFRQLVPLLTNRDISLIRRGRLYSSCV